MLTALIADGITLHLINEDNLVEVLTLFQGFPDSREMVEELLRHYLPQYDKGRCTNYGFYALLGPKLAGMTLLSVDSWEELLGLDGVATGCRVSNLVPRRSLEKTVGLQLEGVMRESGVNEQGKFEDEYLYAILRRDWLRLYDKSLVAVLAASLPAPGP